MFQPAVGTLRSSKRKCESFSEDLTYDQEKQATASDEQNDHRADSDAEDASTSPG